MDDISLGEQSTFIEVRNRWIKETMQALYDPMLDVLLQVCFVKVRRPTSHFMHAPSKAKTGVALQCKGVGRWACGTDLL